MSTEHVVVPTEPCPNIAEGYRCVGLDDYFNAFRCKTCLGDGRRALLDQSVAVEQLESPYVVRRTRVEDSEGDNGGDYFTSLAARRDGWFPVEVES